MGSEYDVFLSHKGDDKAEVELLGARLKEQAGLRPFLDKWHLVPGESWQPELQHAIDCSASAAIFFGPNGTGPWHTEEIHILLDKAARTRDDFRVIPVLLPGASADTLSDFLKQRTWVDFRSGLDNQSAFRRLVAGIKGEVMEPDGYQLPDEPAPYRGLERFEAQQKDYFFGRDSDIRRLAKTLGNSRFLAIVGASGCGKSSLVRAGLHTDIVSAEFPDLRNWQFVTFLPGSDPFRALAEQLAPALPAAERLALVDNLAQRFEARRDGLRTAIDALIPGSSQTILIVVDQFEEMFTHLGTASDPAAPGNVRAERWITNLVDAIAGSQGRIRVLITLRADFIPQCLEFPPLRTLLESNQLLLGELGTEALREAVKFPARRVGAFFENGLVEVILRDLHRQQGSLPLLQHALKELWRARRGPWLTLEAYEKSGGVTGALRRRAEDTYTSKLKDDLQREVARNIFIRLMTLGEGVGDSRRRVPREELFPHGVEPCVVEEVLAALSHKDARLIVVNHDGTVEVTHEALIHTWDTLRSWIDANREQLRLHRRLTDSAKEWDDDGRDASYLYRGGRLEDVEEWPNSASVALNATELAFLAASIAERRRERGERELQQQRELEAAQKLARAETKRAQEAEQRAKEQKEAGAKLRLRAVAAIGAAIAALILLGISVAMWHRSDSARRVADTQAQIATEQRLVAQSAAKEATDARDQADGLINFMLHDLRDKLVPVGRVDVLAGVAEKAKEYLEKQPTNVLTTPRLLQRELMFSNLGDVLVAQGKLQDALSAYQEGLKFMTRLTEQDKSNADWQRKLAIAWQNVGRSRQAQGDLKGATEAYGHDFEISQRLFDQKPADPVRQRDLGVSSERLRELLLAQGELKGPIRLWGNSIQIPAANAYSSYLETCQKQANEDPTNAEKQRELARSLRKDGEMRQRRGDLEGAVKSFGQNLDISLRLAQQDESNADWQQELAISWDNIGSVRRAQGDLKGAADAFGQALAISQWLASRDKGNAEWQRRLSLSWQRIGDLRQAQGNLTAAVDAYNAGLEISQQLVRRDADNLDWQHDHVQSRRRVGEIRQEQADLDLAATDFGQSLEIAQQVANKNPNDANWHRELALSWQMIAEVWRLQADLDGALDGFKHALEIARRMVSKDPDDAGWQADLAFASQKLGEVHQAKGNLPAAADAFTQTLAIYEDLSSQDPTNVEWKQKLAESRQRIGQLQSNFQGSAAASMQISKRAVKPSELEQILTKTLSDFEERRLWKQKGDSLKSQGDLDGAAEAFLRSLEASQRLANQDESDTDFQLYLAESWQDVGEVREAQKDFASAIVAFQHQLAISSALLAADSDNSDAQRLRTLSSKKLEAIEARRGSFQEAIATRNSN